MRTARMDDPYDLSLEELSSIAAYVIKKGINHPNDEVRSFANTLHGIASQVAGELTGDDADAAETWYQEVVRKMQADW